MQEVKVSFYLKRNEEKADGTVPIPGRIRIEKSMVQFSAKVSVPVYTNPLRQSLYYSKKSYLFHILCHNCRRVDSTFHRIPEKYTDQGCR